MPVEDDRNDIESKPSGETGGAPSPPAGPDFNCEEKRTDKLEKDIQRGEWWLIRIGIATLLINTVIALIYWGQLREMKNATTATQQAAYAACVGAQATQVTLRELQSSAGDAHASTVAAIEQANAETVAQQAYISFDAGFYKFEWQSGDDLIVPYSITNAGRSAAVDFTYEANAVIVGDNERLIFRKPDGGFIHPHEVISAGSTIPPPIKPTAPQLQAPGAAIPVKDNKGVPVKKTSREASDYFAGG